MEKIINEDKKFLFEMKNLYGYLYEMKNGKKKLRDIIIANYNVRHYNKEKEDFFFVPMEKVKVEVYGGDYDKVEMLACIDTFHDLQKKGFDNNRIKNIIPKYKCNMIKDKEYDYNNRREKYKVNKSDIYKTVNDKNIFLLILDAIKDEGLYEPIYLENGGIIIEINKDTLNIVKDFGNQKLILDSFQDIDKIIDLILLLKKRNINIHILIDDTNIFDSSMAISRLNSTINLDNNKIVNEVIYSDKMSDEITKNKDEMFNDNNLTIKLYGMNIINKTIDMTIIQDNKIHNYSDVYDIINTMGYIKENINRNKSYIVIREKRRDKTLQLKNIYDMLDIKRLGDYSQIHKCKENKYIFFTPDFWTMVKAYEENIGFIFETPLQNKYILYLPNEYMLSKNNIKMYMNLIEYNETTGEIGYIQSNVVFDNLKLKDIDDILQFNVFYEKNNNDLMKAYIEYIIYKQYLNHLFCDSSLYSIWFLNSINKNEIFDNIFKQYIDKYCKLYISDINEIQNETLLDNLYVLYNNKIEHIVNTKDKNNMCYLLHDFYSINDFKRKEFIPKEKNLNEYEIECREQIKLFLNTIQNNENEFLYPFIEDFIETYNYSINNDYFHIVL